ncbi:RNA polymerase sigma factor, partial [Thermodesulfobacteriota bacterium]
VLILKDLEGFTNNEIAEVMDLNLATVKMRLHRARSELKNALNKKCNISLDKNNQVKCDKRE